MVSAASVAFYEVSFTEDYNIASKAILLQCIFTLFALHFIFNWRKPTKWLIRLYQKFVKKTLPPEMINADKTKSQSTNKIYQNRLLQSSKNVPKIKLSNPSSVPSSIKEIDIRKSVAVD